MSFKIKILLICIIHVFLSSKLLSQVQADNNEKNLLLNYTNNPIDVTGALDSDEILKIDYEGNFHLKTIDTISFLDSTGNQLWNRGINQNYNYFVESSNNGELSVVFEQSEYRTVPKYIIDKNGEEHTVNFNHPRLSPNGKFIYQSNEHYNTNNFNIYSSEDRIFVDVSNELQSVNPNIERSVQMRFLSDNIAALIVIDLNKPSSENSNRNLIAADLVLFSINDRAFVLRHSLLIDSNNAQKIRTNRVNLDSNQMYLVNNRFFFREILLDGSSKINVFDLNSRQLVYESIEQGLFDYTPSDDGLSILSLKVNNGTRRLIHTTTIDNISSDFGQPNEIRRIDDFSISGNEITILQKSTMFENSDDVIIQRNITSNMTTSVSGKFSSVDMGIIKQDKQLLIISRNEE